MPGAHGNYSEQPILSLPTPPAPFLPMETTGSFCLDFPSLPRPLARPWGYPVWPHLAWHGVSPTAGAVSITNCLSNDSHLLIRWPRQTNTIIRLTFLNRRGRNRLAVSCRLFYTAKSPDSQMPPAVMSDQKAVTVTPLFGQHQVMPREHSCPTRGSWRNPPYLAGSPRGEDPPRPGTVAS